MSAVEALALREADLEVDVLDATVSGHVERISGPIEEKIESIRDNVSKAVDTILEAVFADDEIQKAGKGAKIRYISMCGNVARGILERFGIDKELVRMLAIGDVDLPEFAKKVMAELNDNALRFYTRRRKKDGYHYDLASKGHALARQAGILYLDDFYGFSKVPGLRDKLINNMGMDNGGMGVLDLATNIQIYDANQTVDEKGTPKQQEQTRFISPANSFGTWTEIVERNSTNGTTADRHVVGVEQKDLLHLTAAQVEAFYDANPMQTEDGKPYKDVWYITPVGNPSGTKIKPQQLKEVTEAIVKRNPKAIIFLDTVYVRTLKQEEAQELMGTIITNPEVLNRVLFIESFSKTHGIPGERVGMYFAANDNIYGRSLNNNMVKRAGNSRMSDAWVWAISRATPEQQQVIEQLHEFWAKERKGLYHYLRQNRFNHLFEEDQSHILPEQLDNPCGLYVFMRVKPGITIQEVARATGCLGVNEKMKNSEGGFDDYIRFSVGKIKKPTFAQNANLVEAV